MRVRATQKGFFGGVLREPDTITEEFTLDDPDTQFSDEWMVAIEAPAPAPAKPAAAPKAETAPKVDAEKL